MNIFLSIMIASISIIYFEFKLIPLWWLRILVYFLFFMLTFIWTHRREQLLLIQWQQLISAIQSGDDTLNFSTKLDHRLSKYILPPIEDFKKKLRKNNFGIHVAASQISASSQQLSFTLGESNTFASQLSSEAQDIFG